MKALILSTLLAMGHFSAVADTDAKSSDKEVTVEDYGESYELYYQDRIINGGITGGNSKIRKDLKPGNMENLHRGKKEIVLTIDDGPTPGVTDKVLDALKKHNVQATFFVIGSKAKRYTSLMERIANEGHIIANHTMTHPKIGQISKGFLGKKLKKRVTEEIVGAHELLKPYLANGKRWYFRAPYSSWQSGAAKIINETEYGHNYYGPLLWDIGGEMETEGIFKKPVKAADWACWSKKWSVKKCLKGYVHETEEKKGGVVLFHDLVSKSAELIDGYIEEFSKRDDYRFISLDDVQLD